MAYGASGKAPGDTTLDDVFPACLVQLLAALGDGLLGHDGIVIGGTNGWAASGVLGLDVGSGHRWQMPVGRMAGVCRVLGLKEAVLLGMATADALWHPTPVRACAHSPRVRGKVWSAG